MMYTAREKGVKYTDQRVRLSTEVHSFPVLDLLGVVGSRTQMQVLSGIRLIKYYAWEAFYAHHVGVLREREVATIRRLSCVTPLQSSHSYDTC